MRNPHRKILVYLMLSIVAVAMTTYGFRAEQRLGEDWTTTGVALVGFTLAPFGFVFLVNALLFARGRAKLLAGRDVLARWHVTADEWERFRVVDRIRGEQDPAFFNDLPIFKGRQDRGIDVIIGKHSALVGDSYHVLRKGGLPGLTAIYWLPAPADPECLEFHIVYPRYRSTALRLAFRIPFPASARKDARRVYDHFEPPLRPRLALAFRNPKLTIKICLGLTLGFGAAAAWGFWRAKTGHSNDPAALFAAVVGTIIAPVTLFLALLTARWQHLNRT